MILKKVKELRNKFGYTIGITFSAFDLLHAGHISVLAEAKEYCDYLIVGLQTDPTIDRPDTKNKPVQSVVERQIQLAAVDYVDEIITYETEEDLESILAIYPIDVRIIGLEYKGTNFTGKELCERRGIEIVYNSPRDHGFSSSGLRKNVVKAERECLS